VSDCDQFRELIEAYALGALDASERAAFEAHLATGCGNCAKAVAEARGLVAQLAYLAPGAAPSDMLKGRLVRAVRAEAQTPPRQAPQKSQIPFWMWAGVAVLLVFSVYSIWNSRQLQSEIRELEHRTAELLQQQKELHEQLALEERKSMILTDPASASIPMPGTVPDAPMLEAKWNEKFGLCVMGHKVPMPAKNHVLQLWLIPRKEGAKPMPSMTFWPDADGKLVLVVSNPPEPMDQTKQLAITEEPEGGSAEPTTSPRWVGGVS
jgi:anti-sigma-K factor RskA